MAMSRISDADPRIGLNTSDHTVQSIAVTILNNDKPILTMAGSTWNLMNKCTSKNDHPQKLYKNNPWNYTEDPTLYLNRKKRQFDKIIQTIKSGNKDFMFLQEIDCLTSPTFFPNQSDKDAYNILKNEFIKNLKQLGWNMEMSTPGKGIKPLATLYNTKTLQPTGSKQSVLDGVAFECEFLHRESNQKVTLTNLHLAYDKDYSQILPQYQEAQVQANKITFMGGDTNHAPNFRIQGLINNWNNCTNLDGDDFGNISDIHIHNSDPNKIIKKCFDCFAVNPSQTTRAVIVETEGEVFRPDPNRRGGFIVETLRPELEYADHATHQSAPGKPWIRGGWTEYTKSLKQQAQSPNSMNPNTAPPLPPRRSKTPDPSTQGQVPSHNPALHQVGVFHVTPTLQVDDGFVMLYKTEKNELAVKFTSKEYRDQFIQKVWGNSTKPPKTFQGRDNILYIDGNLGAIPNTNQQQLAIRFETQDQSTKFQEYLGLDNKRDHISPNKKFSTLYFQGDNVLRQGSNIKSTLSDNFMNPAKQKGWDR